MNTFKKNQIIITALAIMIAIAGYLNFTNKADVSEDQSVFNNEIKDVAVLDATGLVPNDDNLLNTNVIEELSEETALTTSTIDVDEATAEADVEDPDLVAEVDTSIDTAVVDDPDADVVGEAVFVSSNAIETGSFLASKIEREQVRSSSIDILFGIINNENLSEEQKVDAAAQLIKLQDIIEKEAASESLLEAKGFKDVFVRMNVENVDVVVNVAELTETDLAQISDVVSRKTGIDPSQIIISLPKDKN